MKDLFKKKKGTAPAKAPASPKKSLFAKSDKSANGTPSAKKPLFSFGGKKKPAPANVAAEQNNAPVAAPKIKSVKLAKKAAAANAKARPKFGSSGMDAKKIIIALIGLLVVVVLIALVVKVFFFADEPEYVPPAPAVAQAPTEQVESVEDGAEIDTIDTHAEGATDMAIDHQDMPAETPQAPAVEQAVVEQPAQPVNVPPPAPVATAEQAKPQQPTQQKAVKTTPNGKLTYDEFLKETENRVHRERSTIPPTSTK